MNKYHIILGVLVAAAILTAYYFGLQSQKQVAVREELPAKNATTTTIPERDYQKEFSCEFTSNVGWTECIIEQLDRASAVREWKQRKIEGMKHPEINKNEIWSISENQQTIQKWRVGFEEARNRECEAEYSFMFGSNVPGDTAKCELDIEIGAIKTLDDIYYDSILRRIHFSKGVADFEPSEKDIKLLMKSNKTKRGCVWADDPACNE